MKGPNSILRFALLLLLEIPKFSHTQQVVRIYKCQSSQIRVPLIVPDHLRAKALNDNGTLTLSFAERALESNCGGEIVHQTVQFGQSQSTSFKSIQFLNTGMILMNNRYYDVDNYCLSEIGQSILSVSLCEAKCAPEGPVICISKCCPLLEEVKLQDLSHTCGKQIEIEGSGNEWVPAIYSSKNSSQRIPSSSLKLQYYNWSPNSEDPPLFYKINSSDSEGNVTMNNGTALGSLNSSFFRLLDNGSLVSLGSNGMITLHNKFCIDVITHNNSDHNGKLRQDSRQIIGIPSIEEKKAVRTSKASDITAIDYVVNVRKCPSSRVKGEINVPTPFRIKGKSNGTLTLRLTETSLDSSCRGNVIHQSVKLDKASPAKPSIRFLNSGIAVIKKRYYDTDNYCISRFDTHALTISHCEVKCAPKGPYLCIPKCCPLSQVLKFGVEDRLSCSKLSDEDKTWSPMIYSSTEMPGQEVLQVTSLKIHYYQWKIPANSLPLTYSHHNITDYDPETGHEHVIESFKSTPFRLFDNGSVVIQETDGRTQVHEKFCIDGITLEDEAYDGEERSQIILLPPEEGDDGTWTTILKACAISVALIFLILTVIFYLCIWDKHNIHGWTVFSFVVSMLVFFITTFAVHIFHLHQDVAFLETKTCLFIAILSHFTCICTLCWMSVMNFDFWATFRNLSPSQDGTKSLRRYMYYFAFALGVPTVFVLIISTSLHFTSSQGVDDENDGSLPGYAERQCLLHESSKKYYLYTPMSILLAFNLVMFSWTVFTLYKYKQKTQNATGNSGHKQSWILFCKLFFVMGITWIFEALSGFLDWDFVFFDIVNLLQAVAIFFIFAAKRENLLWVYKRNPRTRRCLGPLLRMKWCYVAELDIEQTEMTSAEKNRTMISLKSRISSGSDTGYK